MTKYKITINEIIEREVPETEYTKLETKNEKGENEYGYVATGYKKIDRKEKSVYEQEIEGLVLPEVVKFLNS